MPKITVQPAGKSYEYTVGKTLLEILLAEKIFVDNPCNGKGVCGKCRVKVLEGNIPAICETERKLLKTEELEAGIRLSCLVRPEDDLEIELLGKERKHEVLTTGYIPDFAFDCDIEKRVIEIHKPTLSDQTPWEDQIKEQLGMDNISFSALQSATFVPGQVTVVLHNGEVIQVEEGDTSDSMYGVAIDIGTTTVVCALIDMHTGKELANASMINAQKHFGLDVLTRITYELEHPQDGVEKLRNAIVESINDMIEEICRQAGISRERIYEITVGANCTMMHTLLGVDATSIGKAPYAPMFVKSKDIPVDSIGIHAAKGARLYCLPSVSAYIGADIVAGAYVCELEKEKGNVLFIDIGTNGEIVLSSHGKLLCCSCAAGPALEGMNISSGMRAAEGAIEDVEITEEGVKLKVIGDEPPIGVCGSGILAVVKELLKSGLVRKDGAFIKKDKLEETDYRYPMLQLDGRKREFIMTESPEKLLITQGDVRQVQLAKGAILSGFIALLNKAGIQMEDLDKVMIAGQFGAHLPADSLTGTGILPQEVEDRLVYVGNSSKTGAYMALMSAQVKREMEELAHNMDYMELGATQGYERLFSDCLIFPDFSK
ncbi:ASKHA domain-containing protein [Bariatricus sp. SGI.161]|uniref:ASKHA domain-containing protein n=1 Tax=Bariatricus sp. SGI.161 TaxID=3420550 RepID=UPI003D070B15